MVLAGESGLTEGYDELPLAEVTPAETELAILEASLAYAVAFKRETQADLKATLGDKVMACLHAQEKQIAVAAFRRFHGFPEKPAD